MTEPSALQARYKLILDELKFEQNIGDTTIIEWFDPLFLVKESDTELFFSSNELMFFDWIEVNYMESFENAIERALGKRMKAKFISAGSATETHEETSVVQMPAPAPAKKAPVAKEKKRTVKAQPAGINQQFTFDNFVSFDECEFARGAALSVAQSKQTSIFYWL